MPPKSHTTPGGTTPDGPGTTKGDGSGDGSTPSKKVGTVDAGTSVSSAQTAVQRLIDGGKPGQAAGATTPSHIPTTPPPPPRPAASGARTSPPKPEDIPLPPGAKEHILDGDGGRQG